ncbi:MAG: Holliday junction branch migration protein RuvA [Candidatus Marinimicrobia bacterium]|nr:Holliday junction branch migration protein RuvA [Candidatus Neomarinimicrobiota bacterium]
MDSISGKLFAKSPTEAIVDIGGIRFRVCISISAYENLPNIGEPVALLTHLHVKEDLLDLYGFKDSAERSLFINLNTISGIGPRSAMNILSGTNPVEFKNRIVAGDVKSLTIIPGIGAKTAKRIIVELKEKFAFDLEGKDELGFMEYEESSAVKDAVNALLSLGYKQSQVNKTLKDLEKDGDLSGGLEEIIRKALAKMI